MHFRGAPACEPRQLHNRLGRHPPGNSVAPPCLADLPRSATRLDSDQLDVHPSRGSCFRPRFPRNPLLAVVGGGRRRGARACLERVGGASRFPGFAGCCVHVRRLARAALSNRDDLRSLETIPPVSGRDRTVSPSARRFSAARAPPKRQASANQRRVPRGRQPKLRTRRAGLHRRRAALRWPFPRPGPAAPQLQPLQPGLSPPLDRIAAVPRLLGDRRLPVRDDGPTDRRREQRPSPPVIQRASRAGGWARGLHLRR